MPTSQYSVKHFKADRLHFQHHTNASNADVDFETQNNFNFKNKTIHTEVQNDGAFTQNDHMTIAANKELRFKDSSAKIYNDNTTGKLIANATNVVLNATEDLEIKASSDELFAKAVHATGVFECHKPLHIKGTSQVQDHMNVLTDIHIRFGTSGGG